ncbi:MAG TPA: 50S ribosomal protein L28 [Candidatus Saccharimonadales bacterium]|nr:50S ribosomal protein L28 [Candidatus Saccharimonadales bacterium]
MSYACEICGKGKQFGHNVPFSQKKTNKVWKPNLQRTRLDIDGSKVRAKLCTQCMRTLAKYKREEAAKLEAQETKKAEKQTAEKAPAGA